MRRMEIQCFGKGKYGRRTGTAGKRIDVAGTKDSDALNERDDLRQGIYEYERILLLKRDSHH